MPGLVGLITKMPREWAEPQLARMLESLRHESFYTSGTWVDESQGVYAGWIARKNSFADGMPLVNETGEVCLLFSGEEYPEPGTALRLKERGHDVATEGPSYLVHLYEDDPSFLRTLNGQFHGLLADRGRGTATLFNDRFGMHRIYYHESKEAFYFAAEAKAILAVRPELRRADARGLGELVSLGCVMENRTLFEGIYLLPSASKWVFRSGSIDQKITYFHPQEWENQPPLEPEPYYCELRDTLARNLPRYFNGDMLEEGVELVHGRAMTAVLGKDRVEALELHRARFSGAINASPITVNRETPAERFHVDNVIIAVGQRAALGWLPDEFKSERGTIKIDRFGRLGDTHFFAAGDVVQLGSGQPLMVVNAVGDGKRVAFNLDKVLRGEQLEPRTIP